MDKYNKDLILKDDETELDKLEDGEKTAGITGEFLKNVSPDRKNSMVPPPPKPGELMYCQICRQPMYPEEFSKDLATRKREFKWQVHDKCRTFIDKYLDIQTQGLMAERKK